MAKTKRNLAAPKKRAPISLYAATKLAGERAKLDEERLAHESEARKLQRRIDVMDDQLIEFVDAYKEGKERSFPLKKFRLRVITKFKGLFYKGELEKLIGADELQRRIDATPTYDKLDVDPIGE